MKQCIHFGIPQILFLVLVFPGSKLAYCQVEAQSIRDDLPYHVQPTRYILRLQPIPEDNINSIPALMPVLNLRRQFQTSLLTITLSSHLEEWATYEVKIHFSGKMTTPEEWGLFMNKYIDRRSGEKKWYVGTKLKPGMARKMFPCFDGSDYKTSFSISIARSDASKATILSNTKKKSVVPMKGADGWSWETFHYTPRMLPSSIGFTMFELDEVVSGNIPGTDVTIYGNKDMVTELGKMLRDFMKLFAFLNDYLERTLPLDKIDVIVFPNFVVDTDTNSWGLIFMSDYFIPTDWTALHGLLDQWFRHFVTPLNHESPLSRALHKIIFWASGLTSWNPTYHLDGLFDVDSSPKMYTERYEWLLRMLNYSMSAETFRLGLKHFVGDRQAFSTYTDSVLWHFMTRSGHHENTLDSSITVQDIAYSWVGLDQSAGDGGEITDSEDFTWSRADQDHILTEQNSRLDRLPIATVQRNYADGTALVEQHVFVKKRKQSTGRTDSFWWIPIIFLTPDNLDPSILQLNTWMQGEHVVRLFVVNYDLHNWRLILQYLKSDKYYRIPELTRSKLLYDAWNMAYFGELDMETALKMSSYLSKETSKVVWEPFLNLINEFLEYISDTSAEPLLERYILKQLLNAKSAGASWISYQTLCRYGYDLCINDFREAYKFWMKQDDLEYKLTYEQFCYTFKYGNMDEFEYGLEYLTKHDIKDKWNYSNLFFLLQTLAICPTDADKINRYFSVIFLEKNGNFSDVDLMTILIRFRNHAQGRWMTLLDFLSHNFASVKDRVANAPHLWNMIVSEMTRHFITQEGLNENTTSRLENMSQAGPTGYEDKRSTGRSVSKRSVDLTDVKEHIADSRLPRDVIPTAYKLELQPYPEEGHFRGHVQINITCQEPTNTITLHAHDSLQIAHSEVTLKQVGGRPTATQTKDPLVKTEYPFNHKGYGSPTTVVVPLTISSTKKEPSKQWYVITLAEKLKKGLLYQLDVAFTGALTAESTQGFFRASHQLHRTKEERWFAATKMSPSNARRVFPCFDEPDLKTPFEISVAHPVRMVALSNMPVKTSEEMVNETGWTMDHFEETPPMSTFSVAIAVLDLQSVSTPEGTDGVNISVFARPSFLSQVQGVLEKTTLIESDFINDEALAWRLAGEIAQQWFGHLVTPAWWSDARINKALANYLATLASNQDKWNWNLVISYSLYYEYSKMHPYANVASQEEYIKITKAKWLLRMLNYTLTENTFKDGLRKFLQERKFKTFQEDDLWGALTTQAREDKTLDEPITVKQIADSWILKDRFPVVTHVFLRQRPHDVQERDSLVWWVPLVYLTPDNLDPSSSHEPVVWMKEEKHTSLINLPGPDFFIIVNPDEVVMVRISKFNNVEQFILKQEYARFLLTRLSEKLGDPKPDECPKKTKLRIIARDFLCRLGHKPCVTEAREAYAKWMQSDDPNEGNPLLNVTILEGNGNFTESDVRLVLNMLTGDATGYTTLFNFLSQNFDELKQRLTGKSHLWEYLVHRAVECFNTQEGLNMVSELYVTRQGEFGVAEPIVEQTIRLITAEAQWSDQNLPAMEAWLDAHLIVDGSTDVPEISSTVAP
ncbi:hypothetical protein C0J52_08613 [Blattella germanica]|nr:hypothetical protein C0J52_08613 [Blattella germanica]